MVPAPEKRLVDSSALESHSRQSSPRKRTLGALLVLGLALFAGNGTAVQQSPSGQSPVAGDPDEQEHQQMMELVKTVELNLRKIDTNLYAASAGRGDKPSATDSGIARLIQQAKEDGEGVQRDIARILELAANHVHKGNGT